MSDLVKSAFVRGAAGMGRTGRAAALALATVGALATALPAKAQSWPSLAGDEAPVVQVRGGRNIAIIAGAAAGIIALGAAAAAANRNSGYHGGYRHDGYGQGYGQGYGHAPAYQPYDDEDDDAYEPAPVYSTPAYRSYRRGYSPASNPQSGWLFRSN